MPVLQLCYKLIFRPPQDHHHTPLTGALEATHRHARKSSDTSAYSLMVEAIAQKADELALRSAFNAEADARLSELLTSGVGMDWTDMRTYLGARASGKKPKAPKAHRRRE